MVLAFQSLEVLNRMKTWNLQNINIQVNALGEDWIVLSRPINGAGRSLQLYLFQDKESLYGDLWRSLRVTMFLFVGFLIGSIFVAIICAYIMIRPLLRLRKSMDKITTEEFSDLAIEAMQFSRIQEVYNLQCSYRSMIKLLASYSKFVPKEFIRQMIASSADPVLFNAATSRHITVLFLHIADFTRMCDTFTEEEILEMLSRVHASTSRIIRKNRGIIDKFIGDCVMVLWGAVNEINEAELHACHVVSLCLRESTQALRTDLFRAGLPVVRFLAGIHCGQAIVGNIGCERRYNFTAVGDTVNVASRLEAANKVYGTSAIVSHAVAEASKTDFAFALLEGMYLCGRSEKMNIYELIYNSRNDSEVLLNVVNQWEVGMSYYQQRQFLRAESIFQDLISFVQSARHFIGLCQQFNALPPPDDWDGSQFQLYK